VRSAGLALSLALALAAAAPARAQYTPPTYLAEPGSLTDRYLSVGEVRDELHGATARFQACFLEHSGPASPGDVNLLMKIGRDGFPYDVQVEIPEEATLLQQCLVDIAAAMTFPAHDGDPLNLAYPLVFVRDDRGSRLVPYPIVFVKERPREFLLIPLPLTMTPEERSELQRLLYP